MTPRETAARALPLLDLTSLNDDDTDERIEALCARAVTPAGRVAAVCIYPRFVPLARRLLAGTGVRIATVVNFPEGTAPPARVADDTAAAVADGADEIDVVMPWRALAAGDAQAVRAVLGACRGACPGSTLKVILETGGLADPGLVGAASRLALEAGADFLKTSTGKLQPAATPEAAAVMMTAIRDAGAAAGFKAAGGIRDTAAAAAYLGLADAILGAGWASPATFRFGASGLLDALLADLGMGPAGPSSGY
ncbi:deoxyribose-phosphate aldolase [Arenibaculum sp.]|uniref:deoxyribose-phosphate aldolase n=1 Tax=Arenibaculum sp. TaxID=2865862 RepID=UPI002E0F0983|nr:deoxyribose-phosphate aldolase [Arenibaculum sp.]